MTNLLVRVGWETRVALDRREKNPQEKEIADRLIAADSSELVDYMLFVDEAPLPEGLNRRRDSRRSFPPSVRRTAEAEASGNWISRSGSSSIPAAT